MYVFIGVDNVIAQWIHLKSFYVTYLLNVTVTPVLVTNADWTHPIITYKLILIILIKYMS